MAKISTKAQVALLEFTAHMRELNDAPEGVHEFNVEPTIQQKLEDKIQHSSAFLSQINVVGVDELKGEKLGLSVGDSIASRTDTDLKERETHDPSVLDAQGYELFATEFNTHLKYARIDAWAKFPDFQNRIRQQCINQQRLDRIKIGWHGTHAAKTTNRTTYPMLQDMNKGWLELIRQHAPQQVFDASTAAIGGSKYKNIDALVFDVFNEYIDEKYQDETSFVVICGRSVLLDKYFPLINDHNEPTEKIAADMIVSQKRMGNLQVVQVPFFPKQGMLITPLSNLSLYYQNGSRRMSNIDNPKRNRYETFESDNEGYVVENYEQAVLIENITHS